MASKTKTCSINWWIQ